MIIFDRVSVTCSSCALPGTSRAWRPWAASSTASASWASAGGPGSRLLERNIRGGRIAGSDYHRTGGTVPTVCRACHAGSGQVEVSRSALVSMRICSAPVALSARTAWAMAARAASGVVCGGTTSSEKWPRSPRVINTVSSPTGNESMRTTRPSMTSRAGSSSHVAASNPTRVTGPRCRVKALIKPGSSTPTRRDRGHQAPSRTPVRADTLRGPVPCGTGPWGVQHHLPIGETRRPTFPRSHNSAKHGDLGGVTGNHLPIRDWTAHPSLTCAWAILMVFAPLFFVSCQSITATSPAVLLGSPGPVPIRPSAPDAYQHCWPWNPIAVLLLPRASSCLSRPSAFCGYDRNTTHAIAVCLLRRL
jgi:hypothetical protein